MEKEARKRLVDPEAEALVEEKGRWNSFASELIGKLISLKRALNGRATDRLPGVSIREPFPSEIVSHLSQLGSEYSALMNDAAAIVHHQSDFSHRFQQRHQRQAAIESLLSAEGKDEELHLEASNWLSRTKAKLPYFGIKDKESLRMLQAAEVLEQQLKQLEGFLTDSDMKSIYRAFYLCRSLSWRLLLPREKGQQKEDHLLVEMKKVLSDVDPMRALSVGTEEEWNRFSEVVRWLAEWRGGEIPSPVRKMMEGAVDLHEDLLNRFNKEKGSSFASFKDAYSVQLKSTAGWLDRKFLEWKPFKTDLDLTKIEVMEANLQAKEALQNLMDDLEEGKLGDSLGSFFYSLGVMQSRMVDLGLKTQALAKLQALDDLEGKKKIHPIGMTDINALRKDSEALMKLKDVDVAR